MSKRIKWFFLALLCAFVLAGIGVLLLRYYPMIQELLQPQKMVQFRDQLRSFGWSGALLLFGIQVLQVLSGIIPALPIQLAAGLSYGAFLGFLICLLGVSLGSILVFALVKRFGQPIIDRAFTPKKQGRLAFLQESKKLEPIVFILYLIPAMPKDVFTYLAALTPLTLRRYLSITLVARAPTIFCTLFASDSLMEGAYGRAIILFCITAALGIGSMLCGKRIMKWLERFSKQK